jgi:hypothetical protein
MNCKCGNKAFFFEKTTTDGTFNVFKCDTQETKKKVKCDFYYSQKIKGPVKKVAEDAKQEMDIYSEVNPRKTYTKDLNKYIRLLKNAVHLPKTYSTDYIANINYILKRLNMKFYFEDIESIECLEKRIKNNEYIPSRPDTSSITFPLKLTEYPLELRVPLKTKSKKRRKMKSGVEIVKVDFNNFIEQEETSKQEEDENDNKSECSDESSEIPDESDNDNDNDNTFDVEDCNSDVDETPDDTGAFSD